MVKFKSKIDLWLVAFLILIFGFQLAHFVQVQKWVSFIFMLSVSAFIVHLFATTFYEIENDKLRIKSGFLVNSLIEIKNIKKISETFNVLSSPALSLDRLEIFYGKNNSILISPKDKNGFFEAIKKINPDVEIVLKNKQN
ncbi:PH domain-containing protein [Flavobacterium sp. KACC 22761]|uniref:PH domain-containing protein n=1 Tax=Flavobacterium sp. KACC 22761 TaxID=3092665 RepID=UPI002A74C4A1|nr:PH domain-containing protein [Flavobacterium sp. KACC 22761]WPO77136.1 PH domain-containing protein [Flavobacterium sp. KACC 22761]